MRKTTLLQLLGLIIMATATQPVASGQVYLLEDGDESFLKVNDRDAAQTLPPGVAAAALNERFENGQCLPRYGVGSQEWGRVSRVITSPATWLISHDGFYYLNVSGFIIGREYYYYGGNTSELSTQNNGQAAGTIILPGQTFTASQSSYYMWAASGQITPPDNTGQCYQIQNPRGYSRWMDENQNDNCVLITDDPRDQAGEDGGVGRAWRIIPGNLPQSIPLNGQDVWGECRLVPCFNGLIMLRHGNERHYFPAANVNTGTSVITLNGPQAWANGDLVLFNIATASSALYGAQPNTQYYVKVITPLTVELFTDSALSSQLTFSASPAPTGTFYLERQAANPGAYTNMPPPLLMQANFAAGQTSFQAGFAPAPKTVAITNTIIATSVVVAPNHRLVPGDKVDLTGITASSPPIASAYACPLSPNTLLLYNSQANAIAGGIVASTGLPITNGLYEVDNNLTGTLVRDGASGVPMPGGREGIYMLQRVIIVNGVNNILISDPLDPLHFTPMTGTITANLGDDETVVQIHPMAYDTLLIGFNTLILALQNLSQPQAQWALVEVTREYGWSSPRAVTHVGSDVWAMGRKGVVSIQQTEFGQIEGVALPVSDEIRNTMAQVLFASAGMACAQSWNNRFFVGLPFKSQPGAASGVVYNNEVLSYNTINQGWETGGGGGWTGPFMNPKIFARLKINGDERLTWVDQQTGFVCWYSDDFTDSGLPIATSFTSRGYFRDRQVLALPVLVNWDTFAPDLTVGWQNRSYASLSEVATGFTYNNEAYQTTKAPDGNFAAPDRQDYAMDLDSGEYTPGVPFDVHQNHIEPFWLRARGRSPQVVISNASGSARINSIQIYANPVGLPARSQT